ncbi:MAG: ATP-binding protein [Succinivibrio sp.]|nr:ATP-binding protein [Succinivibrio sp.]
MQSEIVPRDHYLNLLIGKKWNGRIKVITGIRRCGKSTILRELFVRHLRECGVAQEQIIVVALDEMINSDLQDPVVLAAYLRQRTADSKTEYYVLLDEVQYALSDDELRSQDRPVRLYSVLIEFLNRGNVDLYVTGSNSRLLSTDVSTQFRGRGDVVKVYPLSFREFFTGYEGDRRDAYEEYLTFGGMPYLLRLNSERDKFFYLSSLFEEIYFKDIQRRYQIKYPDVLTELTNALCSTAGSLTNPSKLTRAISSAKHLKLDPQTVSLYLAYLKEAMLFNEALRYDVKGKQYFSYPNKYYCVDLGLRNARLNLRQLDPQQLLENCLYNELLLRGYAVDVGVVALREVNETGKTQQKNCEIDFVVNQSNRRYYIQTALNMDAPSKQDQELRPLRAVGDFFRKIVISPTYGRPWLDEEGICRMGPLEFLLDENSLES